MFRRFYHPLLYRQPAATGVLKEEKEPAGQGGKAEATPAIQASGLYPPPQLARAYVNWQRYGPLFSPAEALAKGTVFPELYSPYPY